MLKIEHVNVTGFEAAIRGMRNPMNSWKKSDSVFCDPDGCRYCDNNCEENKNVSWDDPTMNFCVGINDMGLMRSLFRAGTEHRKYLRMITVTMDITGPLYWWKEFDTYKIGTVANSCSTMHKLISKEFELEDFSHEHLCNDAIEFMKELIKNLNSCRSDYLEWENNDEIDKEHFTKKDVWWQMIQMLPSSYNQKRTVMLNYEVAYRIIEQRSHHKLDEWHELCKEIMKMPYMEEIIAGSHE